MRAEHEPSYAHVGPAVFAMLPLGNGKGQPGWRELEKEKRKEKKRRRVTSL